VVREALALGVLPTARGGGVSGDHDLVCNLKVEMRTVVVIGAEGAEFVMVDSLEDAVEIGEQLMAVCRGYA
jgi:hypothetical protein